MDDTKEPQPESVPFASRNTSDRHRWRRTLSQVSATAAQSLLLLDLGMMIAVPTIVIGVLHNAKEGLSLDDSQSSWFGSIMLLCQPLGSILSGSLQGVLGRKKSMLMVNVPHLAAWYILYKAESVESLYVASFIMGIGIGFLEAPCLSYIGEVCEPRIRSMLAAFTNSTVVVGHILEFSFGCMFPWRMAMLASCSVPVIASVALSLIPESPVWLLTKGRRNEALSSLRWLRGWASIDEVKDEFESLELYCQMSKNEFKSKWEARIKKSSKYTRVPVSEHVVRDKPSILDNLRDLIRPGILKPLQLVLILFFFLHAATLTGVRPYMIEIFTRLKVPLSPNILTVVSAGLQGAGTVVNISLLPVLGKRVLSLVSMTACAFCCLALGAYTYATRWYSMPSIPLFLFCMVYFSMNVGIATLPWLLISEVFPTRGRGVASGVCAGSFYIFAFLVTKTWLNLQSLVDLHGCFIVYGVITIIGILYVFICLPETEGKTLAEIEKHFSKK